MEDLILQKEAKEKFLEFDKKADKILNLLQLLVNNKQTEKLTPEEAAEEQNCTVQTVYAQIKKGILPASKVGRKLLIKRSDLEEALKEVKSLKYKR